MVCVKCMTYNQAEYIKDALNGFCMQKTDFPFVCVIVDDASTDGEQDVILKYLQQHFDLEDDTVSRQEETDDYTLLVSRNKENKNCVFSVYFLKYNHFSINKPKNTYIQEWLNSAKYYALCEGDDYWISSQKLQKQVAFLEIHKDVVLTCHRYKIQQVKTGKTNFDNNGRWFKNDKGIVFNQSQTDKCWLTKTLTLVYRADALGEYMNYLGTKWDIVLVYFLLKQGNGYCFNEVMGIYRESVGIFSKQTEIGKKKFEFLQHKELYTLEKNRITRKRYYNKLIWYLWYTRGKALFEADLSFKDTFLLPYYLIKGLIRKALLLFPIKTVNDSPKQ